MRLCDAIRKGCEMRPKQAFGTLYGHGSSDVLGAAREGMDQSGPHSLYKQFAHVLDQSPSCPECGVDAYGDALNTMSHLNDHHHWTREAIADWIEKNYEGAA